ncbi:hypothetical protein LB503_002007 [Fusarium chuoi]|nr:hypothetical protein LB503_002007 [Fusarium chuoi]
MAAPSGHQPRGSDDLGVFDDAKSYYTEERHMNRAGPRTRTYSQNRRFLIQVDSTLESLSLQEDTDGDMQITIEDNGPKVISLRTAASAGHNRFDELTLAKEYGRKQIVLDEARLNENPVDRLSRMIRDHFWENLTRRIDASTVDIAARDPKDWTADPRPRIYIPQYEFYKRVAEERPEMRLDVQMLPEKITPDLVRDMNDAPGLLAVDVQEVPEPEHPSGWTLKGMPFVVPGGRFNELYGWDSLLINDRVDLAKSMVINFCFCIEHYGKILNATRSYYLCRSQPPFLTDMALRVYEKIKHEPDAKEFLRRSILAAIKEYHSVWITGLSRYRPEGRGVPPETEATHFVHILDPYIKKHKMTFEQFVRAYNHGEVEEPELDEYFMHDRAVRESGHDTSYRLEGPGEVLSSAAWDRRAKRRKLTVDKLMWDEKEGMFFDYDTAKRERCTYESCTTLWALWAGIATPKQAAEMVRKALPKFEAQWDYPYGWPPQQMLAWTGLIRYSFTEEAERIAYKWLFMVTKAFVDFHGVVVEKYDVTRPVDPHRVDAEYGNQGLGFRGVNKEGFAWVNASYIYGLQIINAHMRRALGALTPYQTLIRAIEKNEEKTLAGLLAP